MVLVVTPHGEARVVSHPPAGRPRTAVLLLHGAGSGTDVPVLLALADALAAGGLLALRVEQPYRLAGRRAPAPAGQLDAVVRAVAAHQAMTATPVTLAVGRSSGARVACRVAAGLGWRGVVAIGYPLVPPSAPRSGAGSRPRPDRQAELAEAGVPVLVVQGERDAFGAPAQLADLGLAHVAVHAIAGADHALMSRRRDGLGPTEAVAQAAAEAVAEAVAVSAAWLLARAPARRAPARPPTAARTGRRDQAGTAPQ